jgi:hypothetical protein
MGGAAGIAGGSGAPSNAGGSGTALDVLDPHAAQRKQLVQDMCAILSKYPCVSTSFSDTQGLPGEDPVGDCERLLPVIQYAEYGGDKCWDEWVANAKCGSARTDYCPCDRDTNGCNLQIGNLEDCRNGVHASGYETGDAGKCYWYVGESPVCNVQCDNQPNVFVGADCKGPPNGAQECFCTANGVFLGDQAEYIQKGSYRYWYGDDCADVARQFAAGKCKDILDCCFTWSYTPAGSSNPVEDCGCTADPKQAGYDTCEALAAAGNGKVVDYCPRYRPMPGTFPVPMGSGGETSR